MASDKNTEAVGRLANEFANELRGGRNPFSAIAEISPISNLTGKPYTGFNRLYLASATKSNGYTSNKWLTFNQAKDLGGTIRKGEKGHLGFFWGVCWKFQGDILVYDSDTVEKACEAALKKGNRVTPKDLIRKTPFLKSFTLFNRDQCDGLPIEENTEDRFQYNVRDLLSIAPVVDGKGLPRFEGDEILLEGGMDGFDWSSPELALLAMGEWACNSITHEMEYIQGALISSICAAFFSYVCGAKAPGISAEVAAQIADALDKTPMALYSAASKAEKAANATLELIMSSSSKKAA
jgi:hypothetical protein